MHTICTYSTELSIKLGQSFIVQSQTTVYSLVGMDRLLVAITKLMYCSNKWAIAIITGQFSESILTIVEALQCHSKPTEA